MTECGPKQERAAWIYYQLNRKKTSAAAVGRQMEPPVSRRLMSYVINGQGAEQRVPEATIRRVQEAVAAALEMDFTAFWGETASSGQGEGE
ncbi:MAG: hypothetical protein C4567_08015 [Deltaproteobacteria bacterium]|nr:MAG: hypothetical protein C4567_08015 [Deltaproteobacteria bacterium]